jgi:hypothetical protein
VVVGHARIASRALLASLAPGQVLLLDRVDPRGGLFSAWLALVGHPVGCVSFGTWQPPAIGETAADAVTARRAAVPMSFSGWLDAGPSPIHHPAGPRAPRSESMTSLTSDAESANGSEFGSLEAALDEATVRVEAVIELPAMRVTDLHRWTAGTLLRSAATVAWWRSTRCWASSSSSCSIDMSFDIPDPSSTELVPVFSACAPTGD